MIGLLALPLPKSAIIHKIWSIGNAYVSGAKFFGHGFIDQSGPRNCSKRSICHD